MTYTFDPHSKQALRRTGETLGAGFPPLIAEAEKIAESLMQGEHGRRKAGTGDPFWEYRLATPEDDLSRIDWRQSARTGALSVREKEMQSPHAIYIWCDQSPSMEFSSRPDLPTKGDRAVVLTFALASLLARGGERVGLLNHGDTGRDRPSVATGKRVLDQLLSVLDANQGQETLPPLRDIPRRSLVLWITDGLFDLKYWETLVHVYAARGVRVVVVQILDQAEEHFPYTAHTCFIDPENPQSMYDSPSPRQQKQLYETLFQETCSQIRSCVEMAGWTFFPHQTQQNPLEAVGMLYTLLTRQSHNLG